MLQRALPTVGWHETPARSGETALPTPYTSAVCLRGRREVERLEARRIGNLQSRSRRARRLAREEADNLRVGRKHEQLFRERQTRPVDEQQAMLLWVLFWVFLLLLALAFPPACYIAFRLVELVMPAPTPALAPVRLVPVPAASLAPCPWLPPSRHPLPPPRPPSRCLPRLRLPLRLRL